MECFPLLVVTELSGAIKLKMLLGIGLGVGIILHLAFGYHVLITSDLKGHIEQVTDK